jgi:hypothetical protein
MTDNSGTTADEQSNRIGALAALDRAIDSQYRGRPDTALNAMPLITAGSAKVAFAGDNAAAVSETVQFARNGGKNDPPARR